jgi:hypothetical protein
VTAKHFPQVFGEGFFPDKRSKIAALSLVIKNQRDWLYGRVSFARRRT